MCIYMTKEDGLKKLRKEMSKEVISSRLYWFGWPFIIIGIVLTFTVVGAVIGIPLMIVGAIFIIIAKFKAQKKLSKRIEIKIKK
jgi:hypothetical protein